MKEPDPADPTRHHRSPPAVPVPRCSTPTTTPFDLSASAPHLRRSPSLRPPAHPPIRLPSPYAMIPPPHASSSGNHHSRSLLQPPFFSLDSRPPLPYADKFAPPSVPPSPPPSSSDQPPPRLPPRRAGHRRSQSDVPSGFSQLSLPMSLTLPVKRQPAAEDGCKSEADAVDDLVSLYMDLDGLDVLDSSGGGTEERHDDLDSRASGTHAGSTAESSENEAESWSKSAEKKDGTGNSNSKYRHCRSLSVDSFMGKLSFVGVGEESPKLPPPSPGAGAGISLSRSGSGSMDGAAALFGMEFANGVFSEAEKKKIMVNERLAEIALTDPRRVKRILANRQSAARSKERKMRYISELEHKVQVLQTEATTLSAQLTLLQRDSAGLATQNNELKIRLQAMEQQAQLRDALNEALKAEVQRLKLATREITDAHVTKSLHQKMNSQMIQLQQLQIQQPPSQPLQVQQQQEPSQSLQVQR